MTIIGVDNISKGVFDLKKFVSGVIVGVLMFAGASVFADSASLIGKKVQGLYTIEKNGKKVADAVIIDGSAYAPVRSVAEATGAGLSVEGKKIIMSDTEGSIPKSVQISTLENKITILKNEVTRATGGIKGYESMINMVLNSPGYDEVKDAEKLSQLEGKIAEEQQIIDKSNVEIAALQAQVTALEK
jgi:hypothetical protein